MKNITLRQFIVINQTLNDRKITSSFMLGENDEQRALSEAYNKGIEDTIEILKTFVSKN